MENNANAQISLFNKGIAETLFWSISRHQIIAGAAQDLLEDNEVVLENIKRILEPLGTNKLSAIAGWADTVKRRRPNNDDDEYTVDFLKNHLNRTNDTWHYVNLPLGIDSYSRENHRKFTRDDDVVQILKLAIKSLKSGGDNRFSEVNALRLITHLVGDIHQPIHVGCGFIDTEKDPPIFERDPTEIEAKDLEHDHGGNDLLLTKSISLHSYWDSRIFSDSQFAPNGSDAFGEDNDLNDKLTETDENQLSKINVLSKVVTNQINTSQEFNYSFANLDDTDVENLPEKWATASLLKAREAFKDLRIIDVRIVNKKPKYMLDWNPVIKEAYDKRCVPIAQKQSQLASKNLAELLKAIWN